MMADETGVSGSTSELLAHLRALHVVLAPEGDQLACSAPKGVLNPGLQQELKARKTEILAILRHQNSGGPSLSGDLCVHHLIAAQAASNPDATAVTCGREHISYRELEDRSGRLADRLRSIGIQPEAVVGICLDRSIDMVVALIAVHNAGAAYLPLDPEFPRDRLAFMLEDSAACMLITRRAVGDLRPAGSMTVVDLDDETDTPTSGRTQTDVASARPDSLAYVIYTSGSTGRPKGVAIEHRSVVNLLRSMQSTLGIAACDRFVAVTTLSFDIAALEIFLPLIAGARLIVAPRSAAVDGGALARMLRESQATVLQATPVSWRLLLDSGWDGQPGLKMLCGGEALSPELAARLLATSGELWNLYGPTETTIWSTAQRVTSAHAPLSIGQPIANTQIRILDDKGRTVPTGVAGELYIGGIGLARGYVNRPEETAARFVLDPLEPGKRLYRTGDLVRQHANGVLEYIGRGDQQVKLRGFRIELGEIESVLEQQPGVRQAVVLLRQDDPGDPRLTAYIAPADAGDIATLRHAVAARLPHYMVPSAFVFLDAFPLTANRKVDRKALPAPEASMIASPSAPRPDSSRTEIALMEIWRKLLKVAEVKADDNFFSLGGHSLLVVQLQSEIRQQLTCEISIPDLFERPTIAELALLVDSGGAGTDSDPAGSGVPAVDGSEKTAEGSAAAIDSEDGNDAPLDAESLFADAAAHPSSYSHARNCLVRAQPKGTRRPLFVVAGFQSPDDTLLILSRIIPYLGSDQPVYGFRPRWVWGEPLYADVAEEAREYLAALRTVQPQGPYLLAGYCLSGLIAFEMARQLLAAGEEVGLLALIDTERPSTARTVFTNNWHRWERLQHMGSVLRDLIRRDDKVRFSAAWELVRRKLRLTPEWRVIRPNEAFYKSKMSYQRIIREYVPESYPGRMTLIVNEDLFRSPDPYRGWRGFPAGEMVIHKVSGDHIGIFKQHGRELAQVLFECVTPGARGEQKREEFAMAGEP